MGNQASDTSSQQSEETIPDCLHLNLRWNDKQQKFQCLRCYATPRLEWCKNKLELKGSG